MAENELKHLSRKELLEMLITQSRELERLRKELDETQALLQDKTIRIREAGTMADASIALNRVFESADAAAQQYLHSMEEVQKEAMRQAERMLADTRKQCRKTIEETDQRYFEKKREINRNLQIIRQEICEYRLQNPEVKCSEFLVNGVP